MNTGKGFTLAEMAVAVLILAILLFGALLPFSTQVELRNIAETQRTLDSIREAIIGFAQANGRLPCPAAGATATGLAGAGTEQLPVASNFCSATIGVVPWATLGTPETDAWGRRFTYRVSPVFADLAAAATWSTCSGSLPPPPTSCTSPQAQAPACAPTPVPASPTSFALCTLGDMAVLTRTSSASAPLAAALPLVVISHGKNGWGAWQSSGIQLPLPAAGTDEAANATGTTTVAAGPPGINYTMAAYYSRSPTPVAGGCVDPTPPGTSSASPLCEFDDIVLTISSSTLVARMVAAGRLP